MESGALMLTLAKFSVNMFITKRRHQGPIEYGPGLYSEVGAKFRGSGDCVVLRGMLAIGCYDMTLFIIKRITQCELV